MKQKENSITYTPQKDYDYLGASASTDCTGSVPRPPQSDAELDSYLDVYPFLPQSALKPNKEKTTSQERSETFKKGL
ncbi:hypothetical protein FACS1894111_04120 [Clostridia bacterium]|nr:hypothetical protein FACS1894111_04120 [Clostridia bacterium]